MKDKERYLRKQIAKLRKQRYELMDACKMARDTLDPNCDCNEPEDLDSAFQACFEAVVNAEKGE